MNESKMMKEAIMRLCFPFSSVPFPKEPKKNLKKRIKDPC
mgnify:CR=1 FL=1